MLVLSRKAGEVLTIGNDIKITVIEVKGRRVRVGIEAPANCRVLRGELTFTVGSEDSSAETVAASSSNSLAVRNSLARDRTTATLDAKRVASRSHRLGTEPTRRHAARPK